MVKVIGGKVQLRVFLPRMEKYLQPKPVRLK